VELHGNDARCAVARDLGQSRGKSRLQQLLGNRVLEQRQIPARRVHESPLFRFHDLGVAVE
jgi:hypothetical protein